MFFNLFPNITSELAPKTAPSISKQFIHIKTTHDSRHSAFSHVWPDFICVFLGEMEWDGLDQPPRGPGQVIWPGKMASLA